MWVGGRPYERPRVEHQSRYDAILPMTRLGEGGIDERDRTQARHRAYIVCRYIVRARRLPITIPVHPRSRRPGGWCMMNQNHCFDLFWSLRQAGPRSCCAPWARVPTMGIIVKRYEETERVTDKERHSFGRLQIHRELSPQFDLLNLFVIPRCR